jgi:hypothetical protein
MGLLIDYFVADSDADAAKTIDWPGGPREGSGRWQDRLRGRRGGYPVISEKLIEPVVVLGSLEELLTGRAFEAQLADPESRPLIALRNEGERLVFRIGEFLVTALRGAAERDVLSLADDWSEIEELSNSYPAEDLKLFLRDFKVMCDAVEPHQAVYCWVSV